MIFRIEVWIAQEDKQLPAGEMVCEIAYLRR